MKKEILKIGVTLITFILLVIGIKNIATSTWVDGNNICWNGPWTEKGQERIGTEGQLDILNNVWTYCVQHQKTFKRKFHYVWKYTVFIDGMKGTLYNEYGKVNEVNSYANAKLAYILGGGDYEKGYGRGDWAKGYRKTDRQLVIWNFWNNWLGENGYDIIDIEGNAILNGTKDELTQTARKIEAEADEYAKSLMKSCNVTSSIIPLREEGGKKKGELSSSNSEIGPFNFNFGGGVDRIEIIDDKGEHVTFDDGIYIKQGNRIINASSGAWTNSDGALGGIELSSGSNFYIINPSNKVIKNVKLSIIGSQKVYNGEINILICTTIVQNKEGGQSFINGGTTPDYREMKTDIDIEIKNCSLKVVKEDTAGNRQDNVGFIIYRANTDNGQTPYGYLYYDITNSENNKYQTGRLTYNKNCGFWSGEGDQNSAREGATVFYTSTQNVNGNNWDGFFEISGLPSGTYNIGEIYNENEGFESSTLESYNIQIDNGTISDNQYSIARVVENIARYKEKMPYTQTISVNLEKGQSTRVGLFDSKEKIDVPILKVTKKNGNNLGKDVKFNVYNVQTKMYLAQNKKNGKYEWLKAETNDDMYKTTFNTDGQGTFSVELAMSSEYKITELENPNNNYTTTINKASLKSKPTGSNASVSKASNTFTIKNIDKLGVYSVEIEDKKRGDGQGGTVNIKGKVFVDGVNSKNSSNGNGKYDNGEKLVRNARVYLTQKSNGRRTSYYDTTNTDGYYSITASVSDVSKYYIEFDCSNAYYMKTNEDGREEIEYVKEYSKTKTNYVDNGSKCIEYNNGIGKTYYGTDSNLERKYGLTGNKQMNLGLTTSPTKEYLDQTISKIEINVNGKRYTYYYGQNGSNGSISEAKSAPTVNFEGTDIDRTFTRNIYPSDIAAFKDGAATMSVNVTYVITIRNLTNDNDHKFNWDSESTRIIESETDEYQTSITKEYCTEDYMKVTSITEEFDTSMYELNDSNWDASGDTATYKKSIGNLSKTGGSKDKEIIYITFKVKDDAIKKILEKPNGIKEYKRTTATSKSKHYWSNHIDWKYRNWEYFPPDDPEGEGYYDWGDWHSTNSSQNSGAEVTSEATRHAEAPFCIFKLPDNEERTISGNVFEDINSSSENELVGDGYNDWENSIKNVTVELWDKKTGNKAYLYHRMDSGSYYRKESLEIKTNSNGEYSFTGVVAGDYWIVYRYGNGDQIIRDGNNTKVYSSQYKSTIVQSPKYNYNENTSGGKWYIGKSNESMAVDIITDRNFDDNTYDYSTLYNGVENDRSNKLVEAKTPNFEVGIEFTANEIAEKNFYRSSYNEMNFGIIKMPVVSVNIYNTISYVTMTLSNGQVITQGDPSGTTNIQYVSTLDENDTPYGYGRGGYVKVEIDTNYLYGSTLEVTYDIRVLNNSDLNYKTKDYYYYGTHGSVNDEYTVSIDRILYYIDPAMTYMYSTKGNIEIEGYSETSDKKLESMSPVNNASKVNAGREITKEPKEMLDINLKTNKEIHTYYSKDEDTSKTKSSINVLSVTTSKLLSTEDDDLEFKNYAEVVKITTDKDGNGNICRFMAPTASFESAAINVLGSSEDKLSDIIKNSRNSLYRRDYRSITTDVATITVTPPTGLKENLIIFISIGIGLIVFVGGVIIIKKKVL